MAKVDVTAEIYYSGDWHEVPVYTRDQITITRPPAIFQQQHAPSTLSLSIDNRDGTYSPRNPSSSLFGIIGRNTPIRVKVGSDVRCTLEIESWPQRSNVAGTDVWVPITANGIMRRLNAPGTTKPALSALRRAIDATSPIAYWAMEEPADATALASALVGGLPMVFGTIPPLPGSTDLAPGAVAGVDVGNEGSATGLVDGGTAGSWSVSWVGRYLRKDGDPTIILSVQAGPIRADVVLLSGALGVSCVGPSNSFSLDVPTTVATSNPATYRPHHFVVTATQSGADVSMTLRYDGAQVDIDTITGATCTRPTSVRINGDPTLSSDSLAAGTLILQGHIAVYDSVYTDDLTAAIAAHAGETASARMTRLCSEESISYSDDGGDTELVGVQRPAPFLDLLQDAADADGGILYEPRDTLGLAYRTRASFYNNTSAVTLDYAAGGELAPNLEPIEDTDAAGNDITVTRYGGSKSARVTKETGTLNVQEPTADPDGVGRYKRDYTLVLYDDDQPLQAAGWLRHLGTWDEARYPVIEMDLTAMAADGKPDLVTSAASLDVGDRLTITSAPAWVSHDSIVQQAQGFIETIESHHRTIAVIDATPALPYGVYQVETDTTNNLSRIPAAEGETTVNEPEFSIGETGLTATSTTVPWIDSATYPSQFPLDIMIGGERIRVTAITGTGLTQTFTCTRGINGINKAHATGSVVQLFRPPVIAR